MLENIKSNLSVKYIYLNISGKNYFAWTVWRLCNFPRKANKENKIWF